jgi:putative DNA methylase
MTYSRKLIGLALSLQAINKASAREKFIRHVYPGTPRLGWTRRPLMAALQRMA